MEGSSEEVNTLKGITELLLALKELINTIDLKHWRPLLGNVWEVLV